MPELLTVQDALGRHREMVLDAIREPKLQGLIWEATLACNLACAHCGNPVEGKEGDGPWKHAAELKTDEVKRIFSEIAADFPPGIAVGITGGEATLRADLCEIVVHLRGLGFPVSLTTNGMLTGKDLTLVDRLVAAGVQLFTISIDGLREGHDRQRGIPGSFDLAVRTIRHIREKHPKVEVTVNTIATPLNWHEVPGVHKLMEELKVPLWNLGPVSPVGRARDPLTHLNNEQMRDLLVWIRERNQPALVEATGVRIAWVCDGWVGSQFEGRVRESLFFCGAGTRIASVLYDGKAATCLEVKREIGVQGDLRKERFKDVWDRKYAWFRGDREKFRKGPCATCTEWDWCQGSSLHLREANGELVECIYHRQSRALPLDEGALPGVIETVEVAPLTIVQREGVFIVGNDDTGTFAEMPSIGVAVIRALQAEPRVEAARAKVKEQHGRDVDVAAFVRSIATGGFVAKINGAPLSGSVAPKKQRKLFENVKPEDLGFLRSAWYWWIAAIPFAAALGAMLADPFYRPGYRDFFFTNWYTLVGLTTFVVMAFLIIKHELGHVLMARALGSRAALTFGTRMAYLVVQTDATSLWVLSKKDRMKVYAAGMATDAFVIGVGTMLLALGQSGIAPALAHPVFVGLTKLVVLGSVMTTLFQFFFHVRTDVYYIIAHGLDCRNLYGDARLWLRKKLGFFVRSWRRLPDPDVPPGEMRWVRMYGLLHFVGLGVFVLYFGGIILPALYTLYKITLTVLWDASRGVGGHSARDVVDAILFITIHAAYFGAVGLISWRNRKRDATGRTVQVEVEDAATKRLLAHPAPDGMLRSVGGKLAQMDPERAKRRAVVLGPHFKAAALRSSRED